MDDTKKTSFQDESNGRIKRLARNTRVKMLRKGIKSTEIAKSLNLTKSAISNALAGRRPTLLQQVVEFVDAHEDLD